MNRFLRTSLLAFLMAVGTAAVAQTATPPATGEGAAAPPQPQPAAQKSPRPGDRNCIQSTGSHIPAKPGTCLPVAGRSYSSKDIDSTGRTTLGPALRDLDPSITVGGH
ncbi:hypothetical protein [Dyella sedimenti]|uniref:hypothetical protein n=1 Tax=Dyella sedimenti TaxID=2919947 RepID=UPI001FA997BE|nr:hypothetical protein [Dyella sedimenti]